MRYTLLLSVFMIFSCISYGQSNVKINLVRQIDELFLSSVDSNSNQIVNVDKLGTLNIMYKDKDENVDFNILDLSRMELTEPDDEHPYNSIHFHCRNCMHLTSPSAERRAKFENSDLYLPIKYKALGSKLITKLGELQKQNR